MFRVDAFTRDVICGLKYVNRLSDFLFVASRYANKAGGDVLWMPGKK